MPPTDLNHPCPHCYGKQEPDAHLCGSPVGSWCDEYVLEAYYGTKKQFDWLTKSDEGKIWSVESRLDRNSHEFLDLTKQMYSDLKEECEKRGLI